MPRRTRSHVDLQKLRRDLVVPAKGSSPGAAAVLPGGLSDVQGTREMGSVASVDEELTGAKWEQIDEMISVGRPVGSVLPVAFWWRHTFYRIDSILSRRFGCGRKELTVSTTSGLFRLADQGSRWTLVAYCRDRAETLSGDAGADPSLQS